MRRPRTLNSGQDAGPPHPDPGQDEQDREDQGELDGGGPFAVCRHPEEEAGHSNGSFLKAARAGMMTLVGPSRSSFARNGVSRGQV